MASTAAANSLPSTPTPSSTSTTKRSSGPVPETAELPSTTERVPAPCSTKVTAAVAAAVRDGAPSPSAGAEGVVGVPGAVLTGASSALDWVAAVVPRR